MRCHKKQYQEKGFTLLEILIVSGIITLLSTLLIFNFRSSRSNLTAHNQVAAVIISDIRQAQSLALSGRKLQGNENACGYGISYVAKNSYLIYGVRDASSDGCANDSRLYAGGSALLIQSKILGNLDIELRSPFEDIYFELPFAKTFINNDNSPSKTGQIIIQAKDQIDCIANQCATLTISTAGTINK